MRPLGGGKRNGLGAAERPEGGEAGPPATLPDTVTVLSASISPRSRVSFGVVAVARGKRKERERENTTG